MAEIFDLYKPPFRQEWTLKGAVLWDADGKRVEPYHAAEMLNKLIDRAHAPADDLAVRIVAAMMSDGCDEEFVYKILRNAANKNFDSDHYMIATSLIAEAKEKV